MYEVLRVDPFRCRVWEQHGRIEEYLTEECCKDEIQSMGEHGQLVPAIGRLLHQEPLHDVEIICGARRLFAARQLKIDIAVELRELTDREGIVLMDIENRQRRDWSAYERGRSFARWLAAKHFQSQDDLARTLRISASQVSRLLKMARLPAIVVEAFPDPADICEMWAVDLFNACEDAQRKSRIIARARTLKSQEKKPVAREVFERLLFEGGTRQMRRRGGHQVVLGSTGQPLFRIKHQHKVVTLFIDKTRISPAALHQAMEALSDILQNASAQPLIRTENLGFPAQAVRRLHPIGSPPS